MASRTGSLDFAGQCENYFADSKNHANEAGLETLLKEYLNESVQAPEILEPVFNYLRRLMLLQKIIHQGSDRLSPEEVTSVSGYPVMKLLFEIKEKAVDNALTFKMVADMF